MEPSEDATTAEVVAKIEQKALRLSALLREIDNHPIELTAAIRAQLDDVLMMLGCRVAATRALLHPMPALPGAANVA
jgi:hypothetical protein